MTSQCGATKSSCLDLKGSEGRSQPQGALWDQPRSHLGSIVVGLPLPTPALLTRIQGGSPPVNLLPANLHVSL